MKIQQHNQADDHPDVENEIDTAADADERRQPSRVRR
jgi:hypothetical protein